MRAAVNHGPAILDCTFRDGGYYTNWHFSDAMVRDYMAAMAGLPVEIIELGLAGKGTTAGPFANIDNRTAQRLRVNGRQKLAVMIDAKDYLDHGGDIDAKLDRDLGPRLADGIDIIRLAVN